MRHGAERASVRLEELFSLGRSAGANRPGLSAAEQGACELAVGWMVESGLDVERDAAGNVVGRRVGGRPDLPEVWTGSHLDTVPDGGRFDGALGVVAGLEAVERVERHERTVAVVVFRDEEGVRFGNGCFGSRALCGTLDERELARRDAEGVTVEAALAALGFSPPPRGGWLGGRVAHFVEAHVEQGPALATAGAPLGVVTAIAGSSLTQVVFEGRARHAGTTPMNERADALCAAADFTLALRKAASGIDDAVATVGELAVSPGAANVIPERVNLTVDARAPTATGLAQLLAEMDDLVDTAAARNGCAARSERSWLQPPTAMDETTRWTLREAVQSLGLPVVELASGAGHDAAVLAAAGVPTGVLFVRSLAGGVSHSPDEQTESADIELAIAALSAALGRLASSHGL
jgi:allantoate deiminase